MFTKHLRDWLGSILSKCADRLLYGDGHYLVVRDAAGAEVTPTAGSTGDDTTQHYR